MGIAVRVLVTGSSGHVGSAVAARLQGNDHEVVGLSRGLTKGSRALSSAIVADLGQPGLASALVASQRRCDAIVHAAAAIDHHPFAPATSLTNGLGTQQALELAERWEVECFVYLSSVPVIGRPRRLPVTEDHPLDPPTAYHASKLYGEHLLAVSRTRGLRGVALRLTSPVGPRTPDGRILAVFVHRALSGEPLELAGAGTRGQDYVDVRDIATAVERALERGPEGVLNVASGRCVTNRELAELCIATLDSGSEIRLTGDRDPDDDVRWEVSIAAAAAALDYRPSYTLEDSIAAVAAGARGPVTHG